MGADDEEGDGIDVKEEHPHDDDDDDDDQQQQQQQRQQPRPEHLKPTTNGDYYVLRDEDDEEAQLLSPGAFNLEYDEEEAAAAAAVAAAGLATAAPRAGRAAKLGWRGRLGRQWPKVVGMASSALGKRRLGGGGPTRAAGPGAGGGGGGDGGSGGGRMAHLLPSPARLAARLRGLVGRVRLDGPDPPLVLSISPVKADWQERPVLWLERRFATPTRRLALLVLFLACWLVLFLLPLVIGHSVVGTTASSRDQQQQQQQQQPVPVVHLDCADTLWPRGNRCGLHGFDCRPFSNSTLAFHCPAGCANEALAEPRPVGAVVVGGGEGGGGGGGPLVVGDTYYRGDSFICAAAIHAGVVSNAGGGCGVVRRLGPADVFTASDRHGVRSVAFDSYFPLAFAVDGGGCSGGVDPRGALLFIDLFFSALAVVFVTHPPLLFFTAFVAVFAHVGLVSDPPPVSRHSVAVLPELLSILSARLPPALFVAAVVYRVCVRRALGGSFARTGLLPLRAPVEKLFLWLLPLWLGALANYTLSGVFVAPVSRLATATSRGDLLLLRQPPATTATTVLGVIVLALVAVAAAFQAYAFWAEGRLRRLLVLYAGLIAAVALVAAAAPPIWGLELRPPPYVVSLFLLPATAVQTRASLAAQGLLLGLFVNNVARRGFDPVLRTTKRRSAVAMPVLAAAPVIKTPSGVGGGVLADGTSTSIWSISFAWASPPPPLADGVSVMVNDVERHRSVFAEPRAPGRGGPIGEGFVWARKPGGELPEYFRFAYTWDGEALDYTRAGIWHANGSWTPPPDTAGA